MAEYGMTVVWENRGERFTANRYSREHRWLFDGGIEIPASSSPHVIPVPLSTEAAIDPEEAFVASLSSCHMLWFLAVAAKAGWTVERYEDRPVGTMARNAEGRMAMLEVVLRPAIRFGGDRTPSADELDALHHAAHDQCFIASSVKTDVRVEPRQENDT